MKKTFDFYNNYSKIRKFLAFSLIELMISLITISCITAAFAPVITKRLSNKSISLGAASQLSTNCTSINADGKCLMCLKRSCVVCTLSCPEGQYKDTENCKCVNCSTLFGTNCTKCNETMCTYCKAGYRLDESKATTNQACPQCGAGTYSTGGATTCTNCSDGTISIAGASTCTACSDGQWSDANHTACAAANCSAGYYCTGGDKKKCSAGKWGGTGRTTDCIDNCTAGYYCPGNGTRVDCPAGSKCPAGSSSPATCPEGTYQNSTKQSTCINCTAGKWGGTGRTADCTESCAVDYYCRDGVKAPCGTSQYSGGGASSCSDCSSRWTNCTACTNSGCSTCSGANYANGASGCSACNSGCNACTSSACTSCPTGTYINGKNCTACNSGCNACTSSACTSCPTGTYINGKNCSNCPDGCSKCTSASVCTTCKKGYYLSSNTCTKCPAGKYQDETGQTSCKNCTAGKWGGEGRTSDCTADCTAGYACKNGSKTGCTGTSQYSAAGASSCSTCPSGQQPNSGHTACEATGCTGDDFVKITGSTTGYKYCINKKNMGDSTNLAIPSTAGVTVVNATTNCTGKCCWKGTTYNTAGSGCTSSGYSACTRTVCNYNAAVAICSNFSYGGWSWHLMKVYGDDNELQAMYALGGLSTWGGCANNSGSPLCPSVNSCNGYCMPGILKTNGGTEYSAGYSGPADWGASAASFKCVALLPNGV